MPAEQHARESRPQIGFMLEKTHQPFRLADIKMAHISLALVGLMWVLPFLHYRHRFLLTSFDLEWWSRPSGHTLTALPMRAGKWPN